MLTITFIESSGNRRVVQAPLNISLMEAAVSHDVAGIVAACGGACSCATCVVHIDNDWFARVGPPDGNEQMMIEFAAEARDTSRLSCQIMLTGALDGLVVELPNS